jgi:hypothetical protein
MSARYQPGERVSFWIEGEVSRRHAQDRHLWVALDDGEYVYVPFRAIESGALTVERRWPSYGKPQPGEVWENPNGLQVFAHKDSDGYTLMVSSTGARWDNEEQALDAVGPLRRVYPPVHEPAVPVVEDQDDEPVDERAAVVVGVRHLADLIEAHPDLPASRHNLGVSVYVNNMPHVGNDDEAGFTELRRIAAILGVEPDLRDEPGAMHPSVKLRLAGGVAYEATYITQAYRRGYKPVEPETVVDGSPSDLDGPPAAPTANGLCPYGGVRGDEHEYTSDCCEHNCADPWHLEDGGDRTGPCPGCGDEPAPSIPDGGEPS